MYTLAVAFMLFVLDSGRISATYVILSYFAYACYVLAVAMSDLHHRGWLAVAPRKLMRRARGLGSLRRSKRSPRSPQIRSTHTRGRSWNTGQRFAAPANALGSQPADAGHLAQPRMVHDHVAAVSASGQLHAAGAAHQQSDAASVRADADLLRGGEAILPVSNPFNANATQSLPAHRPLDDDAFTALAITDDVDAREEASSCASVAWQAARCTGAWLAATTAPLRLLQACSIPSVVADSSRRSSSAAPGGSPCATFTWQCWQLTAQAALAFQVPALYFRQHFSSWQAYAWYTALTFGLTLVMAALAAVIMHWHRCSRAVSSAAPCDAVELQGRKPRTTLDADDQMLAVEEARMMQKHEQETSAAEDADDDTIPSVRAQGDEASSGSEGSDVHQVATETAVASAAWQHTDTEQPGALLAKLAAGTDVLMQLSLSLLAFVSSILWIQLVAEELVALLDFLGSIMRVDHTLLGFTLLAWGAQLTQSCVAC